MEVIIDYFPAIHYSLMEVPCGKRICGSTQSGNSRKELVPSGFVKNFTWVIPGGFLLEILEYAGSFGNQKWHGEIGKSFPFIKINLVQSWRCKCPAVRHTKVIGLGQFPWFIDDFCHGFQYRCSYVVPIAVLFQWKTIVSYIISKFPTGFCHGVQYICL